MIVINPNKGILAKDIDPVKYSLCQFVKWHKIGFNPMILLLLYIRS